MSNQTEKATLYRLVTDDHLCPYGLKAKDLLERKGYDFEDHQLKSKQESQKFKEEHNVKTTPQIFINDERIGGYDALRKYVGERVLEDGDTTYRPVIAIFLMALFMVVAFAWSIQGYIEYRWLLENFIAVSMCLLALQKLKDVENFSTQFLNYDLLAKRWVRYGYIYPYAEGLAGVLMIAGALPLVSGSLALFIGGVGALSVLKAVYIDQRELKCACVGGNTKVPLGAVSLIENLMMLFMGIWTLINVNN